MVDAEIAFSNLIQAFKENDPWGTDYCSTYGRLTLEKAEILTKALENNKHIKLIDIVYNDLGNRIGELMGNYLLENETLTTLCLSGNQIDAVGVNFIGKALEKNKTLLRLDLNRNPIGLEGAKILAEALAVNKTLLVLNLIECGIDNQGLVFITEALRKNNTLQTVYVGFNLFDEIGAKSMLRALTVNTRLSGLNIWNNQIQNSHSGAEIINLNCKLMERNREIPARKKEYLIWFYCLKMKRVWLPRELEIMIWNHLALGLDL